MRDREIVGYVVSGPTGAYDYEVETLDEAWAALDEATADVPEELAGGWAIGVEYADGSVDFERRVRRAA